MTRYGLIEDYDYNQTHKRKRYTIWSGPFASVREGEMYSLPKGDGFMITLEYGGKIRVECPVERTDENYQEQDKAVNDAINHHRLAEIRKSIEAENVSYGEISELEGLTAYIDPADTLLLQWAGVPEFAEEEERPAARAYRPNGKNVLRKR